MTETSILERVGSGFAILRDEGVTIDGPSRLSLAPA